MEKIKQWRTAQKLTIEEAGDLIGVSGVQWSRYETGARRIPAEKAPAIARLTGVPSHELRPDVFEAPQPENAI